MEGGKLRLWLIQFCVLNFHLLPFPNVYPSPRSMILSETTTWETERTSYFFLGCPRIQSTSVCWPSTFRGRANFWRCCCARLWLALHNWFGELGALKSNAKLFTVNFQIDVRGGLRVFLSVSESRWLKCKFQFQKLCVLPPKPKKYVNPI